MEAGFDDLVRIVGETARVLQGARNSPPFGVGLVKIAEICVCTQGGVCVSCLVRLAPLRRRQGPQVDASKEAIARWGRGRGRRGWWRRRGVDDRIHERLAVGEHGRSDGARKVAVDYQRVELAHVPVGDAAGKLDEDARVEGVEQLVW